MDWDPNVERFFATVKQQFVNRPQGGNKTYLVLRVANVSPNHGEHLDQEFKSWHSINDISCHSVTGNLYQHRIILVDWYLKHVHINSARADSMFRAIGVFADRMTHQWEASVHLGLSSHNKRFMCQGNQVTAMSSCTSQSPLTRTHHQFTAMYQYFYPPPQKRPIQPPPPALPIWRSSTDRKHKYAFISENISILAEPSQPLEPVVEARLFYGKKRKAVRIEDLGDTNYLMKAADECGEKRRKEK